MSGIIFDHQKEIEFKASQNVAYKTETEKLRIRISEYQDTIIMQSEHIKRLSDFIDETNELMKKELDIVRSE